MTTDGGGWTMCYTASSERVLINSQISSTQGYGTAGHRRDCRNIPFTDVLYVNHASNKQAWFKQSSVFKASSTNYFYQAAKTFAGYGAAAGKTFQMNICSAGWMEVGFMMTGWTGCWKRCNSWCGDTSTQYYRVDGDSGGSYNGNAFAENGHRNVANKLLSVGLR
jgi:hypothetical protein